jgi:hypothetical protein
MKKLIFIAIMAAGAWWHFVGGRKLSEDDVNHFYRDYQAATLQRKPDVLCTLLADDYQSTGTVAAEGQVRADSLNKQQTCESFQKLYDTWDKLGEKLGGILQLDSHYTIHDISISADKKSASVDISTSLDVGGSIMNIRSHSTDTLVRRNGKVLLLRSEGTGSIGTRP